MRYWKMMVAVGAAMLTSAALPALASDAMSDSRPVAADPSAGTAELDGAQAQFRLLDERVEALAKRVDQLSALPSSPAPTEAERKRQERERERQAEFQSQVWTAP